MLRTPAVFTATVGGFPVLGDEWVIVLCKKATYSVTAALDVTPRRTQLTAWLKGWPLPASD